MQTICHRITRLVVFITASLIAHVSLAADTDAVTGATQTQSHDSANWSTANVFAPDTGSLQLANELELTLEQRDRIQLALYELEPRARQLAENSKALREAFMATSPEAPDYATVTAQVSQSAASHAAELVMLAADVRARMAGLLSDEQKNQLKEKLREKHDARDAAVNQPAPETGEN
jgi:hypothetical protein